MSLSCAANLFIDETRNPVKKLDVNLCLVRVRVNKTVLGTGWNVKGSFVLVCVCVYGCVCAFALAQPERVLSD